MLALPAPTPAALLSHWTWQPLAILVAVLLCAWYQRAVRRLSRSGIRWPVRYSVLFGFGILTQLWVTCGFLQVYASSLYWAWTSQTLALLLGVPVLLLVGRPFHLAEATSPGGMLQSVMGSRPIRVLTKPLVGPAVFPVVAAVLFFGPLPAWTIQAPVVGWVVQIVLLALGALLLLPLLGPEENLTSLAVAGALMFGMIEMILDAIPGIVLRLHRGLVTSYFDHLSVHPWTPGHLHDQQTAGTVLWVVAEVIDLPFLLVVFRRWLRADARDAAQIDAVLEAERSARVALAASDGPGSSAVADGHHDLVVGPADAPWWLHDSRPN
ncbi:MAG: cytochrome c oxidase assembly protein [Jatrophihabitantaceae bacterium]